MSSQVENETKKSSWKEIKLTLQQTLTLPIDEQWTMRDIKQAAKKEFGHIANSFTIFIKDYEVTNLDNINLFRTLDYYKSSTIYVVPNSTKILSDKILNEEDNLNIPSLNNSQSFIGSADILNSSGINNKSRNDNLHINKEIRYGKSSFVNFGKNPDNVAIRHKIDDAYNNLDKLKRTIEDFKIRSELGLNKSYYNAYEKNNTNLNENKLNNSFHHMIQNTSNDNLNMNPLSSSMFLSKNKNSNMVNNNIHNSNKDFPVSPIRENTNIYNLNNQPYSKVDEIISNIKNKLHMPSGNTQSYSTHSNINSNLNKNESFISTNNPQNAMSFSKIVQTENPKYQSINLGAYPSPNLSNPNQPLKFPQSEEELKSILEDNRNIHLTNQILNKSNLDLKNQLKRFEEDYEANSELRLKVVNLNHFIENLKIEMANLIKSNEDVVRIYDMLKGDYIQLEKENESLKQKLHTVSENFLFSEKTNQNLKTGIDRFEDALKNYDNEKSILSIHLFEKDKQIFELSEKDKNNLELNFSLKKSLNDYEEMLANMNRTIEILKKSTDDCEKEIFRLKCTVEEKNFIIETKSRELIDKSKENSNLHDELNLIKNELKFFNDEVQTKLKILDDLQEKNSDLINESEKYKMKIQNLNNIIQEKENTVENTKASYNSLNKTFEEIKKEFDEMKRKYADDLIEKNRLLKEKKMNEEHNFNYEKKIEEMLIVRNENENELKINRVRISKLEEENSKLKYTNENFLKEISAMKESNDEKEKLIRSLEFRSKENEERIKKIKNEFETVERRKNEINSEKSVFESKFNEVNLKHENLLEKYNHIQGVYDDLNKRYETLLQQNYKINAEKTILNDNYEKLDKDFREFINKANSNPKNITIKKVTYDDSLPDFKSKKNLVTKLNLDKNNKITEIINGAKFIFTVYDNRSILSFDIENRKFKVTEFADYSDFETKFNSEGSISLNMQDGIIIVTGDNHDHCYFYSHSKNTMNKLTKFKDNHAHGALLIDNRADKRINLLCISGWHNRKVERYYNDDMLDDNTVRENHSKNNELSYLPEMSVERSESSFIIIDNRYLYAFFGYCCPKAKYLDTIEHLDLEANERWEILNYSNKQHISTFIKSHSLVKINDRDILVIGGYDGKEEVPVETFLKFDSVLDEVSPIERKLPDIALNHFYNFQKDSSFVPFIDINNRLHYASIDDMDNVHVIEVKTLQYDVFKFD